MVPVKFVCYKIRAHPLIDKLYQNYHIYRNSSAPKRSAVCKIFTPAKLWPKNTKIRRSESGNSGQLFWENGHFLILKNKKIDFNLPPTGAVWFVLTGIISKSKLT